MSETNCNNRLVLPIRWLTIADMEECGEFDPDFLEYLKSFGGNRASKSEVMREQYEQGQNGEGENKEERRSFSS